MPIRPTFFFFLCWFAVTAVAQQVSVPKPRSGSIIGTVTDVQDELIPGATVVLTSEGPGGQQKATANESAFFRSVTCSQGLSTI
jgi:hypothetical protein